MGTMFVKIFNLSITAGWLILAIIVMRFLFKKAPKYIHVLMWGIVAIRLLCPLSFESKVSLIPNAETIPENIGYVQLPPVESGESYYDVLDEGVPMEDAMVRELGIAINPVWTIMCLATVVWIVGMVVLSMYTVFTYWFIRRKLREAVPYQNNVWLCDHIDTPFILGIIRPRIYLPSNLGEQDMIHVLAHEKAHLKRHDHWWKPLGFLLLTIYWFHPIFWVAYILLCRDIELACDEKVIREKGTGIKKSYSETILRCSVKRRIIAACPLAFGEIGVKARVKSVLHYKKPAFWIVITTGIACVVLSICFLTNPQGQQVQKNEADQVIENENLEQLKRKFPMYFGLPKENGLVVYVWQMSEESYLCGLLPGKDVTYEQERIWNLHAKPATIEEMKQIIASYNLPPNMVAISPIVMPHSSYLYQIDDKYREKLWKMFGMEEKAIRESVYSPIIDTLTFDIDGDGKLEACAISVGPTSGVFTFYITAKDAENVNDEYKYKSLQTMNPARLSFTIISGKGMLKAELVEEVIYYDFDIINEEIVLIENYRESK